MELGIYTFADVAFRHDSGQSINVHQRIKDLIEEIALADEVGLDVFGIGEHHRADYAVSSPSTVLAAAAVKTKNIRLSSAVTVLSSEDPVRVFQQYATIDHLSDGRAEIMAGRGSFIESFPLFGYKLDDYEALFAEKLELLIKLNKEEKINWKGKLTPSIDNREVYPRPYQPTLPVWVAIGGTPESVVRAASYGLPMALAIIGGMPERFVPLVNLYREALEKYGHPTDTPVGINSFAYIADTSEQAANEFFPYYANSMARIGRERGWPPTTRQQFDTLRSPKGSLLVGSPQEVIDKILFEHELFGNKRFLAQMDIGAVPHDKLMRSIELLGTKVAPAVKKAIG